MSDMAELFTGTFLAEVLKIAEAGDFDPISQEVKKGETNFREMTLLEKAVSTFINRREKGEEARKLAEKFLWDFLIYPSVEGEPPLGLRAWFIIVEKPPRPIT